MFKIKRKVYPHTVTREMQDILELMNTRPPDSEEYKVMLDSLERLHKLKPKGKFEVSPDVVLTVLGSLVGTILVLYFEKTGVLTSKAVSWILKSRG